MNKLGTAAKRLLPLRKNLLSDLIAGLTFAVVSVPQAMAHAMLALVNPVLGIYTLMVAVPVGALFTSSVYMNVSTTAAISVAVGAVLTEFPAGRRGEALIVLVLLVGAIQFLAGLFRLGSLTRFVSNAVMTGFLNGVAVLIILGQLSDLTGYKSSFFNRVVQALDLLLRFREINLYVMVIGGVALGVIVMLLFTRWSRFAFIIGIVASTVLLAILSLPVFPTSAGFSAVPTVGDIATIYRSLPGLSLPQPSLILSLLVPAFSVAVIGLIQGTGVSQGTPNPNGQYPDVSRDFLGQGVANLATSFVGGIPAGGSISGTALTMGAGAKSRLTNVFVGLFVVAIVLLAAPLVELVPMSALAALLIVAGFQGLRVQDAVVAWNTCRITKVVMTVTFVATLVIPLQFAVMVGVVLSIVLHVFRQSNQVLVSQWVLQPGGFPLEQPVPKKVPANQLTLLHIYGSLFFAAARNMEEMLPKVGSTTRAVVAINLRGKSEIGSTFVAVLSRYAESLHARDSKLMLVGIDSAVNDQLSKTGVLKLIGPENVFLATPQIGEALNQAVEAATAWLDQPTQIKA